MRPNEMNKAVIPLTCEHVVARRRSAREVVDAAGTDLDDKQIIALVQRGKLQVTTVGSGHSLCGKEPVYLDRVTASLTAVRRMMFHDNDVKLGAGPADKCNAVVAIWQSRDAVNAASAIELSDIVARTHASIRAAHPDNG
jgi:hypothetical protein